MIVNILLETAVAPEEMAANPLSSFMGIGMIVVFFVFMYILIIRPQKKQEKELKQQMSQMKIGDQIVTIGGIMGQLASIEEDTVTIYSSVANTPIKFQKGAISQVLNRDGTSKKADKKADKSKAKSDEPKEEKVDKKASKDEE